MSTYSSVLTDTNFMYCKIILNELLERHCETLNLIHTYSLPDMTQKNSPSNFEFKF